MCGPIHFIVARSRAGWAVTVDADLLSEHQDVREARRQAALLAALAEAAGDSAALVDLSGDAERDD